MEISWLGHSCFRIKGNQGVVITDPYSPETGYSLGKPVAKIVTVSHQHPGHSYVQGISGEPRIITKPGEYEIGGIMVLGTITYHDGESGSKKGRNTVYSIEVDDLAICHLGDLGHVLTGRQVEEIANVDVLLLPVGGVSTLNASLAAEVVRQLEPKIIIPMHYKTPALARELEPVDKFLKEMGAKDVATQPSLTISKSTLPENMQVLLLDYKH